MPLSHQERSYLALQCKWLHSSKELCELFIVFLIIPFPNPSDSSAGTEVRQQQHQPLSKVSLSGQAECTTNDLPSRCFLLSYHAFVHSENLCPHSVICFSQRGSWCETHKGIWKNTLEMWSVCEDTWLFFFLLFVWNGLLCPAIPHGQASLFSSLFLLKHEHNNFKMP